VWKKSTSADRPAIARKRVLNDVTVGVGSGDVLTVAAYCRSPTSLLCRPRVAVTIISQLYELLIA
jgi:hypothetical protein